MNGHRGLGGVVLLWVLLPLAVAGGCGSQQPAPVAQQGENVPPPPVDHAANQTEASSPPTDSPQPQPVQPAPPEVAPPSHPPDEKDPPQSGNSKASSNDPGDDPGNNSDQSARQPALIPRDVLFGNPDKAAARLSPDGQYLSFLAPVDGVLNVWVAPRDSLDQAKPVTHDKNRGIRIYFWAYTSRHILYAQDRDGDENWHIYAVDLASGKQRDLTPLDDVAAEIAAVSHRFPEEILVGLNDRDPQLHDIHRVNITTGEKSLVEENPGFESYEIDEDYQIRFAVSYQPDGGKLVQQKTPDGWKEFMKIPAADALTTRIIGFNKAGDAIYLLDSRDRDTGALTTVDLNTGDQKILAQNDRADLDDVLAHPTENTIQAVGFNYLRKEWQFFDPAVKADFEVLREVAGGDVEITSRTLDDQQWIVAYLMDDGPVRYYHYDRPSRKATFLFTNRQALEGLPLAKMRPVLIEARDKLKLVSYLTLPPGTPVDAEGRPTKPLPMVLLVHGGPWARDAWGFDPEHQLLANRGYAVLAVNFRGSVGFGKEFLNAGNRQWGAKMHDDLIDAVRWAVDQGIADPQRVGIMGASYGGYATLVGLTTTPEVFACGVDIVGPSNLITLLNTIPPYWAPALEMFKTRVGDHTTDEGRQFLLQRSPLTYVDRIQRPLLIGQGANDPRVKQAESDQIVQAMQEKKIPVTYVLFPDEGHGFARPENRLAFYAVTEAFLAEHLGGRYEPVGTAFEGSSITIPAGADDVPGLPADLPQPVEKKNDAPEPSEADSKDEVESNEETDSDATTEPGGESSAATGPPAAAASR